MKGDRDRDRDPHWSTGLKSQGPNQEQKESEHEQGMQDREGCTHTGTMEMLYRELTKAS
ncbi:hypothetical protein ACRRTK_005323 [Alexandromys fortis]